MLIKHKPSFHTHLVVVKAMRYRIIVAVITVVVGAAVIFVSWVQCLHTQGALQLLPGYIQCLPRVSWIK